LRGRPTAPTLHPLDRSDIRCPPADKSDGAPPSTSPCAKAEPLKPRSMRSDAAQPAPGSGSKCRPAFIAFCARHRSTRRRIRPRTREHAVDEFSGALITATLTARGASGARTGCPSTSHKESRYRRRLRFDHIRASIWPPALFATSSIILASVALYAAFLAV
jgi:hypothetical protein